MPQLSIIIPVFQEAATIGKLVHYLLNHHGTLDVEILVVDGGSQDDTVSEATKAGATILHCPKCSRAAQMNMGAAHADAELLYFVHADTFPPESYISDIFEALKQGYDMGCFRYRFDSRSWLLRFNAWFVRFPWLWCQGGDKTFFIRRKLFWEYNGYDEHFVVMEEYDFLQRIMPRNRLRIIPKNALVSARKYEKNSWLRVQLANIGAFSMFRRGVDPRKIKAFYKSSLHP